MSVGLANLEGHHEFDITYPWQRDEPLLPGMTAVLRVKNEADSLPWVLPPLFRACREVLVVDNQSDDGTADVARETAKRHGAEDRLRVAHYPFDVARAGEDHLSTHERSVHSLSYFYNWSFSLVRTRYSLKWDGDMVLTTEGEISLGDLNWQADRVPTIVHVPRHGLYVVDDRRAYLDVALRNAEEWGFPMGPDYLYTKAFEWEMRMSPPDVRRLRLPQGNCVELKYLHGDEFGHWTSVESFATSKRTQRKRREYEVFRALQARIGLIEPDPGVDPSVLPEGIVEFEVPEGSHVIDHVTHEWLPSAPRPLSDLVLDDLDGPDGEESGE